MNQEKIGKFIASLRKEKNLTQQELAEILGVSDKSVSRWENGKTMPDLSLMQPLCQELGITINELLSGEKLKKEEYQEKSEENILNTIDYSNKKIKHTKSIFIFLMTTIGVVLITLGVLFGIDINRMRNNEPVFFSTWGFLYAPPINIEDAKIENAIKDYLILEDEENQHYDNEKSFVAMRTYLLKENSKSNYYVYAWVLQKKYYLEDGKVKEDSGSSIPYKFEVVKTDNTYEVRDYDIPRDGSYYERDMKHIFPNSVLRDMDDIHNNGDIERLELEIENQVKLYFHE